MRCSSKYFIRSILLPVVLLSFSQSMAGNVDYNQELLGKSLQSNLVFEQNKGQFHDEVQYKSTIGNTSVFFLDNKVVYIFSREIDEIDPGSVIPYSELVDLYDQRYKPQKKREISIVTKEFLETSSTTQIKGEEILNQYSNYLLGNDRSKWQTRVSSYESIVYTGLYEKIDLKYYFDSGQLKYDIIAKPGADLNKLKIKYNGIENISIDASGQLVIQTSFGAIKEKTPAIYQERDGVKNSIHGKYELIDTHEYQFIIDDYYDPEIPLIIDPLLSFSSYVGGSVEDWGYGIDFYMGVSPSPPGIFIVGTTWSDDFLVDALGNVYKDTLDGLCDVFISKIDPSGSSLIYSTYIGGSDDDWGYSIAVDDDGCAYITGRTSSTDFPISNATYDTLAGKFDAFLTKISSDGSTLDYSSYLGGRNYDIGHDIVLDGSNDNAYITGITHSDDFPSDYGDYMGYWDIFVASISTSSSIVNFSRLVSGSYIETAYGIDLDNSSRACITGWTWSEDYSVVGSANYYALVGEQNIVVTRLSSNGQSIDYSAIIGGGVKDYGKDIKWHNNEIYITGWTSSTEHNYFPLVSPYDSTFNGGTYDAFGMSYSIDSDAINYCTYLGGNEVDCGYAIEVDDSNCAYITGRTESDSFPVYGLNSMAYSDSSDVFITKLSASGSSAVYSSCYGGDGNDWGYDIDLFSLSFVPGNVVLLTGITNTIELPNLQPGDYNLNVFNGAYDVFLASFIFEDSNIPQAFIDTVLNYDYIANDTCYADSSYSIEFQGSGVGTTFQDTVVEIDSYKWVSDIDGFLSDSAIFSTPDLSIGTHNIQFTVQDELLQWSVPDTAIVVITTTGNPLPIAYIDSIIPNPAQLGESVIFYGSGLAPGSEAITNYEWNADIPGFPYTTESCSLVVDTLGSHEVSFRVKDSQDEWSNPVTAHLFVNRFTGEEWEVSWWYPESEDPFKLQMNDTYQGSLIVKNIGQTDQEFNFSMGFFKHYYDFYNTEINSGNFNLDSLIWFDDNSYVYGTPIVDTLTPGETKVYMFKTRTDWDWIDAWDLGRLIPIFISAATSAYTPVSTIATIILTLDTFIEFMESPKSVKCRHVLHGDARAADSVISKQNELFVRPEKIYFFWMSYAYGYVASKYTSLGFAILATNPPPSPGALASIPFFITEALLYAASEGLYVAAYDPNTDFTTYVDTPPVRDSIPGYADAVESLGDGCFKYIADEAFDLYSLASSCCSAYVKCAGALDSSQFNWAIKHLASAQCYAKSTTEMLEELSGFSNTFSIKTIIPDSAKMEYIRDTLDTGGLPDEEEALFTSLGLVGADSVANTFYNYYDPNRDSTNICSSFVDLPENLLGLSSSLIELTSNVISHGTYGALIGDVVKIDPPILLSGQNNSCEIWVEFPATKIALATPVLDIYGAQAENISPPLEITWVTGDYNTDGDTLIEVKMSFNYTPTVSGKKQFIILGQAVTVESDTIPFSTAALFSVYDPAAVNYIDGCVISDDSFENVSDVIVELYILSNLTIPIDTDTTDDAGKFSFEPTFSDSIYSIEFSKPGFSDTTLENINIAADDTTKVCLALNRVSGYKYLPGDANMAAGLWPPAVIGSDVTYLVNYFRGISNSCILDGFFASADANGDCLVIGSDVTFMVNYLRGISSINYCPDFETDWTNPNNIPVSPPEGWPNCE